VAKVPILTSLTPSAAEALACVVSPEACVVRGAAAAVPVPVGPSSPDPHAASAATLARQAGVSAVRGIAGEHGRQARRGGAVDH